MASGLSSQDHGEGVILDIKQMNMAPDPVIEKLGHNFVTLKWSLIKDQRRIGYISKYIYIPIIVSKADKNSTQIFGGTFFQPFFMKI